MYLYSHIVFYLVFLINFVISFRTKNPQKKTCLQQKKTMNPSILKGCVIKGTTLPAAVTKKLKLSANDIIRAATRSKSM